MEPEGREHFEAWSAQQLARIKNEREKLTKRLETVTYHWEAYEEEKRQMKISLEEHQDPELQPELPRMVERGIMKVTGKQDVLKTRMGDITKRLKELDTEEEQLQALLAHEKFPEWLELKQKRDKAAGEVAQLEAAMKQLMETIMRDARVQ